MEFFIRKNSTLPVLEVELIKDGRTDFNYTDSNLSGSTILFSMKDVDNQQYKVLNGTCIIDQTKNSIYYKFNKKNTIKTGRYVGEFSITNDQGKNILPIKENLYVNVLDSFSNSEFCCKGSTIPKADPIRGIYFGKINSPSITLSDINLLTFDNVTSVTNTYVSIPEGLGYSYILIPTMYGQPSDFRDSTSGCFGNNIPTNNIGQISIVDINGNATDYNIYRSFFSFYGQINNWMCA